MKTETQSAPRLLRAAEVAARLGITQFAVYRMAREGRIGGVVRMGRSIRWHAAELEDWLRAGGTDARRESGPAA